MSKCDAVTEKNEAIVGKITFSPLSESERLHEIDMRVGARLAEREILRGEYSRGFLDCFTIIAFIAAIAYGLYFLSGEE